MPSNLDHTVALDKAAVVTSVVASVTASATPRMVRVGEVAQVRSDSDIDPLTKPSRVIIVDFGTRRMVSALRSDLSWTLLESLHTDPAARLVVTDGAFAPTPTQELRITFANAVAPAQAAAATAVGIAIPPADLEIMANGSRAWLLPGMAEPGVPAAGGPSGSPGQFQADGIDLTRALQDEVAAGRVPVRVLLRSRTPGALGLTLKGSFHRVHEVAFPEGPVHSVEATAEGDLLIVVPLPPGSDRWEITGVEATVAATCGPERADPATGPPVSPDAALVVDPDRSATVRLPEDATRSLAALTGVRIPIRVGVGGAELRGALRADHDGEPGPPIARGQLGPAAVEYGPDLHWVSLVLPKPQKLQGLGPLWVDVAATRGSVEWPLGVGSTRPGATAALRRATPAGGHRRLSRVADLETGSAVLRVVGVPPANAPIFPADLAIAGADSKGTAISSASGVAVSLQLTSVLQSRPLVLRLTARTKGTFAVGPVTVSYNPKAVS